MTINSNINLLAMRIKLSTLWITVLLNMLFRDMHEFARTGFLEEIMAMTSNGAEIPEIVLLGAAIVLEIPISMIFLTQILNVKVNRLANLIAPVIIMLMIISNNLSPDLDDIFFVIFECIALLLIIWYAWGWSNENSIE